MSAPRAGASLVLVLVLLWPAPLLAQRDAFVVAIQELAAALMTPEPARQARLTAAIEHLESSLREWDRDISALEARRSRTPPAQLPLLRIQLARHYLDRGRPADAARELEPVARDLREPELHLLRALALDAADDPAAADAARQEAWRADPSHPVAAYHILRQAGHTADDLERARATMLLAYRELVTRPTPGRLTPFPTLGVVPDSFAGTPVVADEVTARGIALLAANRYDAGAAALRADLRRAAAGDRGTADSSLNASPLAHFVRGRGHENANRTHEARRAFESAAAGTLVGRSALFAGIGRLAQIEGDFDGATLALERAIGITPNDAATRRALAQAYGVQARTDEAFAELIAALLIDDGEAQAHAALGRMFLDASRDQDAVTALRRAIQLAPDAFETRYALAAALTRVGRTDEAARELETFEQARRDMVERQRQQIAGDVRNEEALRERLRQGDTR